MSETLTHENVCKLINCQPAINEQKKKESRILWYQSKGIDKFIVFDKGFLQKTENKIKHIEKTLFKSNLCWGQRIAPKIIACIASYLSSEIGQKKISEFFEISSSTLRKYVYLYKKGCFLIGEEFKTINKGAKRSYTSHKLNKKKKQNQKENQEPLYKTGKYGLFYTSPLFEIKKDEKANISDILHNINKLKKIALKYGENCFPETVNSLWNLNDNLLNLSIKYRISLEEQLKKFQKLKHFYFKIFKEPEKSREYLRQYKKDFNDWVKKNINIWEELRIEQHNKEVLEGKRVTKFYPNWEELNQAWYESI